MKCTYYPTCKYPHWLKTGLFYGLVYHTPKGQLISKCVIGVSNSSKNELENSNFCPILGQKFFVRFLGELKKTKISFEINQPLERAS